MFTFVDEQTVDLYRIAKSTQIQQPSTSRWSELQRVLGSPSKQKAGPSACGVPLASTVDAEKNTCGLSITRSTYRVGSYSAFSGSSVSDGHSGAVAMYTGLRFFSVSDEVSA